MKTKYVGVIVKGHNFSTKEQRELHYGVPDYMASEWKIGEIWAGWLVVTDVIVVPHHKLMELK